MKKILIIGIGILFFASCNKDKKCQADVQFIGDFGKTTTSITVDGERMYLSSGKHYKIPYGSYIDLDEGYESAKILECGAFLTICTAYDIADNEIYTYFSE